MQHDLGNVLTQYEQSLGEFRADVAHVPALHEALFDGFEDWVRQLTLKLAPRLAGEGCLIVAFVGGTNTGKSTVFNCLLERALSPVSPYGALTKHPVVAANALRYEQCLEQGKLLPDSFLPKPLDEADMATSDGQEDMSVFVARHDALPDRMALLDTPDIDSIAEEHWELAKSIREAGDVLIAILTGQKYADQCVVKFFREALETGRLVVPLMNIADDQDAGFAITRGQLDEFCRYLSCDEGRASDTPEAPALAAVPKFVMPRRAGTESARRPRPVSLDDGSLHLMAYLESLDAVELKRKILADSLSVFTQRAQEFFDRAGAVEASLNDGVALVEDMAREASLEHRPKPGREVVTVVHDFIQERATGPDRVFGAISANMAKVPGWLFTKARSVFRKDKALAVSEQELNQQQRRGLEAIAHRLYGRYSTAAVPRIREGAPEAADYFEAALRGLDPGAIAARVAGDTVQTDSYIADYRAYAFGELEKKWKDRKFRWTIRSFYNLGLLGSGAGMLVLLWSGGWMPGLALSEVLLSLGIPVLEHTAARGAAYLWGDKLAGLIRKWQGLQQGALEKALLDHLTYPALGELRGILASLERNVGRMKELNAQCHKAC